MQAKKASRSVIAKKEKLLHRVEELHEFNPMLGHRGCRLGITYPEITRMQVRAIIEAACELAKKGKKVVPEIMIPLVGMKKELQHQKELIKRTADEVMQKKGVKIDYLVGTMIELPRAAVVADEIAQGRRVLLLRHQRPDPDDLRVHPRRRGQVPQPLHRERHHGEGPLPDPGPGGRRPAGEDGRRRRAARPARTSRSASAASTAATRRAWSSATRSGSTT